MKYVIQIIVTIREEQRKKASIVNPESLSKRGQSQ